MALMGLAKDIRERRDYRPVILRVSLPIINGTADNNPHSKMRELSVGELGREGRGFSLI